jgi:hypothetical protein
MSFTHPTSSPSQSLSFISFPHVNFGVSSKRLDVTGDRALVAVGWRFLLKMVCTLSLALYDPFEDPTDYVNRFPRST